MGGAQHYAVKLKKELFPTDIIVDIPFSSDHREMFSEQILTAVETALNNSLWSMGKWMSTISYSITTRKHEAKWET